MDDSPAAPRTSEPAPNTKRPYERPRVVRGQAVEAATLAGSPGGMGMGGGGGMGGGMGMG